MTKIKFKKPPAIFVSGSSNATAQEIKKAEYIGGASAEAGWWVLTGGVNKGIMHAALKGAKEKNPACVTIGILPHRGEKERTSQYADRCIPTGMGEGRNNLLVLTGDIVVVCCNDIYSSPGTFSELIFAIKHKKPLVCLYEFREDDKYRLKYVNFLEELSLKYQHKKIITTHDPKNAIEYMKKWLEQE